MGEGVKEIVDVGVGRGVRVTVCVAVRGGGGVCERSGSWVGAEQAERKMIILMREKPVLK